MPGRVYAMPTKSVQIIDVFGKSEFIRGRRNMRKILKKYWHRCRFVVIYTLLSLRYSKAKPWSWTLAEVALKEAIKNISKSSWQKELNEVLYKSWLTQRAYKKLIKILQSQWESSVPWKLNNANRKSCTHDFKPDVGIT